MPKPSSSPFPKTTRLPPTGDLGDLMRYWREIRAKNQLELSLDTGISQKQISFLENGRSTPGRDTLMCITEALDVPLRERNQLFVAAGYAPVYPETPWNAGEMNAITNAIKRILRQHEPLPGIVLDRYWNVVMTNDAAPRFFGKFIDLSARKGPRNMLHLIFDPAGLRPFIVDWEIAAKSLLQRVYREATSGVKDQKTYELLEALLDYPGVQRDWKKPSLFDVESVAAGHPVIPLSFRKGGKILRYFSMVTSVGTAQTVAAQELRIETMFPLDDETETLHQKLMEIRQRISS